MKIFSEKEKELLIEISNEIKVVKKIIKKLV
jgi:hypothetical protein